MYNPAFRSTKLNVPVVSKKELDIIGEKYISDFCPQALRVPKEIDIDRFISRYLGMHQDYQYLSHCGCYLGMTVFNDTDRVPIYDPEADCADYISAKAGTVLIDNRLLEPKQEHRYRFTVGHEGSHHILHTDYFGYNPDQLTFFNERIPMVQCRIDNKKVEHKPISQWTDADRMEWQANYLSSAILMPKSMVISVAKMLPKTRYIEMITLVSETFNVSFEAAQYRLKGLDLIPKEICIPGESIDIIGINRSKLSSIAT